jgi:hypothetical protein
MIQQYFSSIYELVDIIAINPFITIIIITNTDLV